MIVTRRNVLSLAVSCIAAPAVRAEISLASPLTHLAPARPSRPVDGLSIALETGAHESLEAYRGRTVVLNMWGSWCFPCRDEMPALSRLAEAVKDLRIAVLPLAIERRGAEAVHRFFASAGIANLPVRLGDGENVAQVFNAWGLPYTVLIDRQGREFARVTGPAKWDDAEFVAWLEARSTEPEQP